MFTDYLLVSIAITPIFYFIFLPFGIWDDWLRQNNSLVDNFSYIIFYIPFCLVIIHNFKLCLIDPKLLIGDLKIKNIPWTLVLIIFFAEHTLSLGVNYLEYYFINLFCPDLVQSFSTKLTEGYNSHSGGILFQIFYYALLFFVVVIVAPISEEFIFRGAILHRWAVKWGVLRSIILSSLLFGVVHWDIAWFSRAVGSVFIALFYIQTKTLLVPIILHALNNGLFFVDVLFSHFKNSEVNNIVITNQYLWYGFVDIFFALAILTYFLKFPQKVEQLPYFFNQKLNTSS